MSLIEKWNQFATEQNESENANKFWQDYFLKEKDMYKEILASDIGITPMSDGKVIRLTFPQPTEERRRELTKQTAKMGEDTKVSVRNIRRDAVDAAKVMKKNGEMTEDELKASEKLIQDLTDKYIKEIDAVTSKKNAEIMEV